MATVVELCPSVVEVDFENWAAAGVNCVLLDKDGTLTNYGDSLVFPDAAKALLAAREAGHISLVGIFTHEKDQKVLSEVAEQIEIDGIFIPASRAERKPNPTIIHRASSAFGIDRSHIGVVGDKFTADIKAAIRAGLPRAAWVERYGSSDHLGDRLVRRPWESIRRRSIAKAGGSRTY